jgi:hypothetical protein
VREVRGFLGRTGQYNVALSYLNIYCLTLLSYFEHLSYLKIIKVMKKIKCIFKLYYVINYIIVKIHNNYKFYFK